MEPRIQPIRVTQIILLALAMGVFSFTLVVVYLRLSGMQAPNPEIAPILLAVAAGVGFSEIAVYIVLRKQFLARAVADRAGALALVKQDKIPPQLGALAIIGAALAEGVGLLGVVALLLGAPWYGLALPVLAIVAILLQLPTRGRVETLLQEHAR